MKRALTIAIPAVVVVLVAFVVFQRVNANRQTPAAALSTATVQRGTLSATVSSAGNIASHQTASLSFGQSGPVQKVYVQVGDRVKAGQLLAEVDSADLKLQLQNARVNLKNAQAKLAQARNPNTAQDIANARAKLDAAQAGYDKVAAGPTAADVSASQAALASAQAAYDAAVKSAGAGNSQLQSAAATLQKAEITLQSAQAAYDRISSSPNVAMSGQASTLQQATIDYQTAKASYDALAATADTDAASKLASARSQLQQAQANLAKTQSPVTAADLASAQAQLTQAKNDLDKLLAGSDANTLDIAQNGVDQAEISVQQAQLALQKAQIVAPFDATVTAVAATVGQAASSGAIQIADLDHLEIVVNMAEVDVNRVKLDQEAQITLDALPDATLQGKVTQIAPAGVQSQGVVNYPVTISLLNPAEGVKTGMTANLNIVVDSRNDVLMVPNRAVRTSGRQRTVTVLFEGQQMAIPVGTGLSNDTMTEITSGLKEGDTVVLNTTTTATGGGGFRGPGIGIGGGFGR